MYGSDTHFRCDETRHIDTATILLLLLSSAQMFHFVTRVHKNNRGGKSIHIMYLSRSTDTCVNKDSGKSTSTDSTPVLK